MSGTQVTTADLEARELRFFTPFQSLPDEQLIPLAGLLQLEVIQEGTRLQASGDSYRYFLLSGVIELQAQDGMRQIIESGSEKARTALIVEGDSAPDDLVALSRVRLLKVEADLLAKLGRAEVADTPDEAGHAHALRENNIYQAIRAELHADRLVVPSLPEVALRIKKAVEGESANISRIARIVGADPAITAKLIKIANGPLYRGNVTIDNCQAAIVRLGMDTTKQLVISFAMRDLFRLNDPELKRRVQETWRHSTEVGAICMVLARHATALEPEQALLAGLLHAIGVVPILSHVQADASLRADPRALDQALMELRGEVGAMILQRWGFPAATIQAARKAGEWHYDSGAQTDYADLVIIARLHSYMKAGKGADYPPMEQLPAFAKLTPALTPQDSLRIIDQAKGEMTEIIRLLAV
jgi:HD-like signal output (HDOD) protein